MSKKKSKLFTEADSWGFMCFNSLWCYIMIIHGGCLIIVFLYYSMLITLPVIFLSRFYFYIHTKEYPITVITLLCNCIFACVVWSTVAFFLLCSVYSQVSPPPSRPHSHFPSSPKLPLATKNTDIYSFFLFTNLLRWSRDSRDNTAVLSQLSRNHQSPTGNKRDNRKGNKSHTNW